MAYFTQKQERNGATGDSGTQNTAQPSTDLTGTVSGLQDQAEAAALSRGKDTLTLFSSPAGSGPSADSTVGAPDRQIGATGSIFEWDAGLAINEMPGEA